MNKTVIIQAVLLAFAATAIAQQHEPEYVYVSGSPTTGYIVNRTTGALTALPGSPFALQGQPIAVAPTGQFVFEGQNGISAAKIDRATGALVAVAGSPFAADLSPTSLAVSPNGRFLFVVSGTSLYSFSIDGDVGAITPAGSPVTGISGTPVVSPSSKFLYCGSTGYSIDQETGALRPFAADSTGSSPVFSPDGKYLYSIEATLGMNTAVILGYAVDAESGALTAIPGSPFPAANTEALVLDIDPTGRFLYQTANDIPNQIGIAGFLINSTNGAIESTIPGSPFEIATGFPVGLVIDRSGKFLYAQDGGANLISQYSLNTVTGSLSALAGAQPKLSSNAFNIVLTVPQAASTATLTKLGVGPVDPSVSDGVVSKKQFTASGTYSDGTNRFLTASVTWTSSNPSVATISNTPGESGIATIVGVGQCVIEARLDGMHAQTTLTVLSAVTP